MQVQLYNTFLTRIAVGSRTEYLSLLSQGNEKSIFRTYSNSEYFMSALELAAPDFHRIIARKISSNEDLTSKEFDSLHKYINRYATRPTPFGLFAAQRYATLQESFKVPDPPREDDLLIYLGFSEKFRIDILKADDLENERFMFNSLLTQRGDFLSLYSRDSENLNACNLKKIKNTPILSRLMTRNRSRVMSYYELVTDISELSGIKDTSRIDAFIQGLVSNGVLVPVLDYQPITRIHCLSDALILSASERRVFRVDSFPSALQTVRGMESLAEENKRTYYSDEICDTFLSSSQLLNLTSKEKSLITKSVRALILSSASRSGRPSLVEAWADEFERKFGRDDLIPLKVAIDPVVGIGGLDDYQFPSRDYGLFTNEQSVGDSSVESILNELFQSVKYDVVPYVTLTKDIVESFSQENTHARRIFPYLDFTVSIGSDSYGQGKKFMARSDAFGLGGHTAARFMYGASEADRRNWKDSFAELQTYIPDMVLCDLKFATGIPVANQLNSREDWCNNIICLNTLSDDVAETGNNLSLEDIFVGVDSFGPFLYSKPLCKKLLVLNTSAINPALAPNVARLMLDISGYSFAYLSGFSWRQLEKMPMLPEVRYMDVILRPAEWRIDKRLENTAKGGLKNGDFSSLRSLLRRKGVPETFYYADGDNRLFINSGIDHSLRLFCREVSAKGSSKIEASSNDVFDGILASDHKKYSIELVCSLFCGAKKSLEARGTGGDASPIEIRPRVNREWLSAYIYLPFNELDDVLRHLVDDESSPINNRNVFDSWFFIRYADPRPHIRLRLHVSGENPSASTVLSEYCRRLVDSGLVDVWSLHPFIPECQRYGEGSWLRVAEVEFNYSSVHAISLLSTGIKNDQSNDHYLQRVKSCIAYYKHLLSEQGGKFDLPDTKPSAQARDCLKAFRQELVNCYMEAGEKLGIDQNFLLKEPFPGSRIDKPFFIRSRQGDLFHMHINRVYGSGGQFEKDVYWLIRRIGHIASIESTRRGQHVDW